VKYSLTSQSKPLLKPSRIALKHLQFDNSLDETLAINNWIIRKHFKEMTRTFLSSFSEFLRIDYAVKGSGNAHLIKFNLTKPFVVKEFLDSITKDNAFCRNYMDGSKEKTVKLYKQFVHTTMFRKYLNDKKKEIVKNFQMESQTL